MSGCAVPQYGTVSLIGTEKLSVPLGTTKPLGVERKYGHSSVLFGDCHGLNTKLQSLFVTLVLNRRILTFLAFNIRGMGILELRHPAVQCSRVRENHGRLQWGTGQLQ